MNFFKSEKTIFNIVKGIALSLLFTLILLFIFSAILTYTNLSEETIKPTILILTGVSILIGSSLSMKKLKKNGLINGAVIGGGYMIILYILSSILNSDFRVGFLSIIMITIRNICRNNWGNNWNKFEKIAFYFLMDLGGIYFEKNKD